MTGVGRRIDVGWIKSVEEVWPGDIRTSAPAGIRSQ